MENSEAETGPAEPGGLSLHSTHQTTAHSEWEIHRIPDSQPFQPSNLPARRRRELFSSLGKWKQQGWQVESLERTGASLFKLSPWRYRLIIAGLFSLPLMGFGALLWLLALLDGLSGSRQSLRLSFEGLPGKKALTKGILGDSQRLALAFFGLAFALWLAAALPVYFPGSFHALYRIPSQLNIFSGGLEPGRIRAIVPLSGAQLPDELSMRSIPEALPSPTPTLLPTERISVEVIFAATRTPFLPLDPTATATITSTATPTATPLPDPERWMDWPVIPEFNPYWLEIYTDGIEKGNDPQAFSVVGDCQSVPYLFMGLYDGEWYARDTLADSIQDTVDFFKDSYSHFSMTIIDGGTAASMISSGWVNRSYCDVNENPLTCELRLNKPSFIIVNIGTHWTNRNGEYLRKIVQTAIDAGVIPILATKGDNLEGDHSINREIAQIASEYEIPLWNLWRAVQDLPGAGLDPWRQGGYMYYTSAGLEARRVTALDVLDMLRQAVAIEAVD